MGKLEYLEKFEYLERDFMAKDVSSKTAITRKKLSMPMQYLYENSRTFLTAMMTNRKMLDYGCGKGFDADNLNMDKFDPNHYPWSIGQMLNSYKSYDLITCNYVLNVIECPNVRAEVLMNIHDLLKRGGIAYISVRDDKANLKGHTKIGTWQGFVELDRPLYVHKKGAFRMYRIVKGVE